MSRAGAGGPQCTGLTQLWLSHGSTWDTDFSKNHADNFMIAGSGETHGGVGVTRVSSGAPVALTTDPETGV